MYSEAYDQEDVLSALAVQVARLEQKIHQREMFLQQTICTFCGGPHLRSDCNAGGMFMHPSSHIFADHEFVDYRYNTPNFGSMQQDDQYNNTYYPRWTDQPNFDWDNTYS